MQRVPWFPAEPQQLQDTMNWARLRQVPHGQQSGKRGAEQPRTAFWRFLGCTAAPQAPQPSLHVPRSLPAPLTTTRVLGGRGRETGHKPLRRWREKREPAQEEEEEEEETKELEGHGPAGKRQGHRRCTGSPRAAQRSRTGQREAK